MNNRIYASQRDRKVLEYIELLEALNTFQIKELAYPSLVKTQQRMKVLSKKLNRIRLSIDSPYIYYFDRPAQLEHVILRNWGYVWLSKQYIISNWQNEVDFEILRCDALCKIKSPWEERWVFIEADRDSNHKFDKFEKYTELYDKQGYINSPLMNRLNNPSKFPKIIIISDRLTEEKVHKQNPKNLSFTLVNDLLLSSSILHYKSCFMH